MILYDHYHQIKILGYGYYSLKIGKEVYFGGISIQQQTEALNAGFAPALPLEMDTLCASNYSYPTDWTNPKYCPF